MEVMPATRHITSWQTMGSVDAPRTIGVAGAGTMGAGIAQLACVAGARTLLHDPLPEALDRGHAVFVLHGAKLRGGFALQRTRRGERPQWLLIKRRDEHARPGSDIVAERPESVASAVTLAQLLDRAE